MLAVASLAGCAYRPEVTIAEARAGESARPYAGLPWYLEPADEPLEPSVGRYSARVPVAGRGRAPRPAAEIQQIDITRRLLADADLLVVSLRDPATPAARIDDLESVANQTAYAVEQRPDLIAEAREMQSLVRVLRAARGLRREHALNRLEELTDLIRLQLDTG
jgi:hypothetical protein